MIAALRTYEDTKVIGNRRFPPKKNRVRRRARPRTPSSPLPITVHVRVWQNAGVGCGQDALRESVAAELNAYLDEPESTASRERAWHCSGRTRI